MLQTGINMKESMQSFSDTYSIVTSYLSLGKIKFLLIPFFHIFHPFRLCWYLWRGYEVKWERQVSFSTKNKNKGSLSNLFQPRFIPSHRAAKTLLHIRFLSCFFLYTKKNVKIKMYKNMICKRYPLSSVFPEEYGAEKSA